MLKIRTNRVVDQATGDEVDAVHHYHILFVFATVLMLSACSSGGISDLEDFIIKVKAENPGKVEPLPELKAFEKYAYSAFIEDIKDPFVTWATINPKADRSNQLQGKGNGLLPDGKRAKETLEAYPLETLTLMGSLEFSSEYWGLIKAPDGIVYRVRAGNYIGQNHGKITVVTSDDLSLVEIVSDGLGGWKNRQVELSLNDE